MLSIKQQQGVKDILAYYIYQLYFVQIPKTLYKNIKNENDQLLIKNLRYTYDDLLKQSTSECFAQTIDQIHRFFQNSLNKPLTETIFQKMIILTFIPEIKQAEYESDKQFNCLKLILLLVNQQMKNYLDQKTTIEQILEQTKNPEQSDQYKNMHLSKIINILQKSHQLLEIQLTGKNVNQYTKEDIDENEFKKYKKQSLQFVAKIDILQKKNSLLLKQNTILKNKVNKLVDTINRLVNRDSEDINQHKQQNNMKENLQSIEQMHQSHMRSKPATYRSNTQIDNYNQSVQKQTNKKTSVQQQKIANVIDLQQQMNQSNKSQLKQQTSNNTLQKTVNNTNKLLDQQNTNNKLINSVSQTQLPVQQTRKKYSNQKQKLDENLPLNIQNESLRNINNLKKGVQQIHDSFSNKQKLNHQKMYIEGEYDEENKELLNNDQKIFNDKETKNTQKRLKSRDSSESDQQSNTDSGSDNQSDSSESSESDDSEVSDNSNSSDDQQEKSEKTQIYIEDIQQYQSKQQNSNSFKQQNDFSTFFA